MAARMVKIIKSLALLGVGFYGGLYAGQNYTDLRKVQGLNKDYPKFRDFVIEKYNYYSSKKGDKGDGK